jgi:hypothetical protein
MNDLIEISDLEFKNSRNTDRRSANFGGGLELLMNDKVKDINKPISDINIEELNELENELNELVDDIPSTSYSGKSDIFNKPSVSFDDNPIKINYDNDDNLGKSTLETENDNKTWDGYGKFNNIPINPDKNISLDPKMSKEDLLKEKFKYLRKLETLEKKGVELSKKYTMESSLQEMIGEYETIVEEKNKSNSVKFQGNMLMTIINGIEFLNTKFDPFDIKLDGWSEQIQENINDYDDVFAELYEKYKTKASMAPELKLLFQLGGSAMMVHMTNTMFKSAMPNVDDIFRQNPDLMRSFQNATLNSISQSNPGFSGFMNNIINPEINTSNTSNRGPPPPINTQGPNSIPPPYNRPGNNDFGRPDLNLSRSNFNDGISLKENFSSPDLEERTTRRPIINNSRPEMKGPSDINDILSGLKTKTINIQEQDYKSFSNEEIKNNNINEIKSNDNSIISLNDIKDLQNNANLPKRSRRKKKSESNTISLDL